MCGNEPTGSVGSVPSGRFTAASFMGVPHHGGSIAAWALAPGSSSATAIANATIPHRLDRLMLPPSANEPYSYTTRRLRARPGSADRPGVHGLVRVHVLAVEHRHPPQRLDAI